MSTSKPSFTSRIQLETQNESDHTDSLVNTKSVRKVSVLPPSKKASIGKADSRYWQQPGKLYSDPRTRGSYSCKIQVHGRRESFPLLTANKAAAAAKAAKIYGDIAALGWEAALAKHKPNEAPVKSATTGELIRAVEKLSNVRRGTLVGNVGAFRRIVAQISNIETTKGRTANGDSARKAWHSEVDAVPLSEITPEAIEGWKLGYVSKKAGGDEMKARAARNTVNSTLRCAKSLFAKRLLRFISERLELPSPLPFDGVELYPRQHMRYVSKIDVKDILSAAREDLAKSDPEAYKAAVLSLFVGLRRNEADKLRWSSVDFERGIIQIEAQPDFAPKAETSLAGVQIDAELGSILRSHRAEAPNAEYILEGSTLSTNLNYRKYRAERTWKRLIVWLRAHGVNAQKPNHELRKEAGSIINENFGLHSASEFLRHADISTTAKSYVDNRKRVTVGLGSLLAPTATNIVKADFEENVTANKEERKSATKRNKSKPA
jgi:integrase